MKLLTAILMIIIAMLFVSACTKQTDKKEVTNTVSNSTADTANKTSDLITKDQAKAIALEHAGYNAEEVRREYAIETDEYGNQVKVLKREVVQTKHIPGDPRAAEFWLKNRMPDKYKDRPGDNDSEENEIGGVIIMPEVKEVVER